MGVGESIYVAAFLMVLVFVVLLGLYGCVRLFSALIAKIQREGQ